IVRREGPELDTGRSVPRSLEEFFGFRIPHGPFERRGEGSGVIARADGYILTNNHVVREAGEIQVTLDNGRQYEAEVVGADMETDLAVIKIDSNGLTPARFGDSEALQVGQWVLAVGNPFGLEHTVTAGIVSAKGRSGVGLAFYENLIQTDAAINPGNSGGPLVNLSGEVVGINAAITTQSGGNLGIGFAIPGNMARLVMNSILDSGHVVRGYLGVQMAPLTEKRAESSGYEGIRGVIIDKVTEDGPAEQAGLKPDDILLEVNGRRVTDMIQLRNLVATIPPGKTVDVIVFRKGARRTIPVTTGERPPLEVLAAAVEPPPSSEPFEALGVTVAELTPDRARRLGARRGSGVVVTAVTPDSLADEVEIQVDDIILNLGDARTRDLEDFRAAMEGFDPQEGVRLRLRRDGGTVYVLAR
ncbi:MAG: Do family serine endopeptidase, partial [Planctomycetota bacterium]